MTTATIRSHRHAGLGVAGRVTGPIGTRPAPAPQPNYVVRRLVVAFVALSLLAAGIVAVGEVAGALSDLGGRPAAASEVAPSSNPSARLHVAVPGDTLWSIADTYRGEVSRDRYLDTLEAINGGTAIQAGQAVRLP
ncbi:MAG TPA: LysM domain-containing protein [Ilumatobacteraceae bacterium]|nr:LysM domain-containing protein [Ilumatobacteraceae bacterium]